MDPKVSIVIPLHNDEGWVAASLTSCAAQTLHDIEVICVDDASTDETPEVVQRFVDADPRFRLIRLAENSSAFHGRRMGVDAASAPFVMFLDGDDELAPQAAEAALAAALATSADVVGFGVSIITSDGNVPQRFENALQPRHQELHGSEIITQLFPVGEEANGHLWRYLFGTHLLRGAYADIPADAKYFRANDLPITFLTLAQAQKYVSIPDRLYRYNFQRGTSGHAIGDIEHFRFLLSGVDPITNVESRVRAVSAQTDAPDDIIDSYASARLHIIGNVLKYCIRDTTGDLQRECLTLLADKIGPLELTRAAIQFVPAALGPIAANTTAPARSADGVKHILLTTAHLDTGGLQSVLVEHAAALVDVGYAVTIAVMRESDEAITVPEGIEVVCVREGTLDRLDHWVEICQTRSIDLIIDHHLLYNERWPWLVLAALAIDVPTIGWLHNFSLRPLFDHNQRVSFLTTYMRLLLAVVTLSPTDVAFWKMQGLERVVYLPNPASALTRYGLEHGGVRELPTDRLELAWWGRLDGPTKQVLHLVDFAAELKRIGVDFRLRIIGPDSKNLTARQLRRHLARQQVAEEVEVLPALGPDALADVLAETDLMVSTSAIEGYQLTILEAQALGIPVVMYDLPWLATVRGNDGLIATPVGEPAAMAAAVAQLADDPQRYAQLSQAGRRFAQDAAGVNVGDLLHDLITDTLDAQYTPEPTVEDARILTLWLVRYSERSIRHFSRQRRNVRQELEAKVTDAEDALSRKRQLIHDVERGISFRVGRFITYIPRVIRDLSRDDSVG